MLYAFFNKPLYFALPISLVPSFKVADLSQEHQTILLKLEIPKEIKVFIYFNGRHRTQGLMHFKKTALAIISYDRNKTSYDRAENRHIQHD